MGIYVYKVAAKATKTFQGRPVHVATYAYKPYWTGYDCDKINAQMHFKSGAASCDRWWDQKSEEECRDVLVEVHGLVYEVAHGRGSFYDDMFDRPALGQIS